MRQYPGFFIVFEGGEGTGKTTQIQLLHERLIQASKEVLITREPGGTDCLIAEKIRQMLKDPENREMCPETEMFLFLASRAQHVKQIILPHLESGNIVICDRFFGSTFAYQHFGRGLFNLDEVKRINAFATAGLIPDITILLDLSPRAGRTRISSERQADRFDDEKLEFHERVRQGYLSLAKSEPNWRVISADDSVDAVHNEIWDAVSHLVK